MVTQPSLTLSIAREAIRHGKPLLIEKPLAIQASDAHEIVQLAARNHIPLMTAQTLRYEATIIKLKEMAPQIGKWKYLPLTARMEQRHHSTEDIKAWDGRGALLEIGIHLLDFARFISGEEIQEVYCELVRPAPHMPEDQAWVRLTTFSGLRGYLDVSRVSNHRITRAEIVGEQGQACADWTTSTVQVATDLTHREEYPVFRTHSILSVLKDFFHSLENHLPMPVTGLDGQRAVEIAEACYESAATGRPVTLL